MTSKQSFFQRLLTIKWISYQTLLQWYPIFIFLGLKIKISSDYRNISIRLPNRWYIRNNTGILFGGAMCASSDPFPALLFERIIPGVKAWTVAHSIEYIRPAYTAVTMTIHINEDIIKSMAQQLEDEKYAKHTFEYYFTDEKNHRIAIVRSTAFIKKIAIKN
jgi:hypothetical protein